MRRIVRAAGESAITLYLPVQRPAELPSRNTSATSHLVKPERKPAIIQILLPRKPRCLLLLNTSAITRLVFRTTAIAIFPDSPQRRPVRYRQKEIHPGKAI